MDIKFVLFLTVFSMYMRGICGMTLDKVIKFDLFSLDNSSISPYVTKITIGSPPRNFKVLVDTGSDLSWIDCSCTGLNCFNTSDSSTASIIHCENGIPCKFNIQYMDESFSAGYLVSDLWHFNTLWLLPISSPTELSSRIVFGCSTSKIINPVIDGIIGLGRAKESIVSQLFSQKIAPPVISQCLGQKGDGYILLGEAVDNGFYYSPLIPSEGRYQVSLDSISVGGIRIATTFVAVNSTVVDSGTTLMSLIDSIYNPLVDAVTSALNKSPEPVYARACYNVPSRDSFPEISITLTGGATIRLVPEDYLLSDTYWWCLGFRRSEYITILGDMVLRNKVVVYDQPRERIGLLNHNCSQSVNVSLTYKNFTSATGITWMRAFSHLVIWFIFV